MNRAGHALPATRTSHLPSLLLLYISLHFEARQQFDIIGNVVPASFLGTNAFFAGSKLSPFLLKGVARLRLVVRAPFLVLIRADFELAVPRDIEFRHGIRDKRGVQGSQNNDRQVNQHFRSPNCVSKR